MQQTEAYTVRNTNLYSLYKYLQHFILFHIFHLLTEKQRECRAKENQVQVPLPSKGHAQLTSVVVSQNWISIFLTRLSLC